MLDFLWSGGNKPSPQGSLEPDKTTAASWQAAEEASRVVGSEAGSEPPASVQEPVAAQGALAEAPSALPASEDSAHQAAPAEDPPDSAAQALAGQALGYGLAAAEGEQPSFPRLTGRCRRGRRLVPKEAAPAPPLTPQQRLLLLDIWRRSGLPAGDFAALVGLSKHTLYAWQKKFTHQGPAGLLDQPRGGPKGSRLPDLTKRTILLLKQAHPEWGCQRISDLLLRGPALPASAAAVARVLHEAGYELEEVATHPHADHVRHFERAKPNQLWQTDLFTFVLKRQNRRVYLVAFLDDHSRFIVGYGLHASQSSALVLEVLRAARTSYGTPQEILTDNGSQYVTWRGKSAFAKELEKRGIRQVVAAPRRPQTLGKIERFWGTLWRECVESAVFLDLADAQRRIGLFIDSYNFQRPHRGADGLVPADRYFGAAEEVKKTLQARVAANALELARHGVPKAPFYVTGQVGGQPFSVHAEGERVILSGAGGRRQEVDLGAPPERPAAPAALPEPVCPAGVVTGGEDGAIPEPPGPGASSLDEGLERLRASGSGGEGGGEHE